MIRVDLLLITGTLTLFFTFWFLFQIRRMGEQDNAASDYGSHEMIKLLMLLSFAFFLISLLYPIISSFL